MRPWSMPGWPGLSADPEIWQLPAPGSGTGLNTQVQNKIDSLYQI